jgi:hypothetical protein
MLSADCRVLLYPSIKIKRTRQKSLLATRWQKFISALFSATYCQPLEVRQSWQFLLVHPPRAIMPAPRSGAKLPIAF